MAESTFAIYKCNLKPTEESMAQGATIDQKHAQRILSDALHSLPKMYKRMKDGTEVPYTTSLLRSDEGIFIFRISDPKGVQLVDVSQNTYDVTNYPPCYVIFDNRDGICQVAIERKSDAFNSNPDKVRSLLEDHLRTALAFHKLDIQINIKKRIGEFWEVVNERLVKKDRVKSVKFSFPNPQAVAPIEGMETLNSDVIKYMTAVASALKATKGTLQYDSEKNKSLDLKQEGDIANMVALCCVNGYDLSVQFEKYGEFKYGEEKRMVQGLDIIFIAEYIRGADEDSYAYGRKSELENWLDRILVYAQEYEDGHDIIKRGKGRNKTAIRQ